MALRLRPKPGAQRHGGGVCAFGVGARSESQIGFLGWALFGVARAGRYRSQGGSSEMSGRTGAGVSKVVVVAATTKTGAMNGQEGEGNARCTAAEGEGKRGETIGGIERTRE